MSILINRTFDYIFVGYFASHIIITLLFDTQVFFTFHPEFLHNMIGSYCKSFRDVYLAECLPWYKAFVLVELVFHLPFFFYATKAFYKGNQAWIRYPAIVYGVNTFTSVFSILAAIMFSRHDPNYPTVETQYGQIKVPRTFKHRFWLLIIYLPYFVIPLILTIRMMFYPPRPIQCDPDYVNIRPEPRVTEQNRKAVKKHQ